MKWEKLNSQNYDSPKREYEEEVLVLDQTDDVYKLVLHNDDVNTFDFVIECLIEICKHTPEQAEQCTLLVHYKGKCTVKTGAMDLLKPMHQKLLSRGLTSEIV
ncbi:ATP-dependent Clp protease adaptor ClpS [Elizabethkingia sp. HX WHF]|jgi:ATP-dependent Clp protease adaptor protein ClpS|uniref:ATP-dependent Clp protease adaptor ClpS n=4 Tax=Elizabethkingia TaxID=308865 RepID=A0AAP1BZ68_ELIMR|nr:MULTISPECIES: ATP-dependent Clp protease adaptor ClpS [Elizabethkingia]MDR2229473.1 ATP-dependent Clp protease adaptor ClpS [Flavobacteriaceae bacterium]AJW63315.1 ATP-dependent Clp protease adapter protein ClpS [Elizabethkingia miricola]AQX09515.1 Clp protease ClpS [Elizabethkingia ursingii]AQX85930.1 Clp protease ClpS [Elizabethkingia bruuniana]ATL45172.1 Clp protease ClpS [Elizabethkingia miricola]